MSVVYPDPIVVSPPSNHSATVFMMHGLGDTAHGWSGLGAPEQWGQNLPHVKFVFPNAPTRRMTLNGGFPQTAWYDIDSLHEDRTEDEKGIQESFRYLSDLVESEIQKGIPSNRIVIAGYSQGGAMALSMLRSETSFAGVIGLSCYLPVLKDTPIVSEANRKTPILMCHGTWDETILFIYGEKSFKTLQEHVENIRFESYEMGHAACGREIEDVHRFLVSVLPSL